MWRSTLSQHFDEIAAINAEAVAHANNYNSSEIVKLLLL